MKRIPGKFVWFAVVAVLALGLCAISKLPYWGAFLIVAGSILINGWFAALEDDMPGGFNNPDGTATPKYVRVVAWCVRGVGLACLLVIAAIAAYVEFGHAS